MHLLEPEQLKKVLKHLVASVPYAMPEAMRSAILVCQEQLNVYAETESLPSIERFGASLLNSFFKGYNLRILSVLVDSLPVETRGRILTEQVYLAKESCLTVSEALIAAVNSSYFNPTFMLEHQAGRCFNLNHYKVRLFQKEILLEKSTLQKKLATEIARLKSRLMARRQSRLKGMTLAFDTRQEVVNEMLATLRLFEEVRTALSQNKDQRVEKIVFDVLSSRENTLYRQCAEAKLSQVMDNLGIQAKALSCSPKERDKSVFTHSA